MNRAIQLRATKFPDCSDKCGAVRILGASECESVCPYKFNKDGEPLKSWSKTEESKCWEEDAKVDLGILK